MKITVIGAGNVGGLTALRLCEQGCGEIVLLDIALGLAKGKVLDLEDSLPLAKKNYRLTGSDSFKEINDSEIVIITAGLPRRPGMSREDLLKKNAQIVKDVCKEIKVRAPRSIVIVVTNPVDILTYLAYQQTGFLKNKVLGMGVSLDTARFSNLISQELNIPNAEIETMVIGCHGETMLPLTRLTYIKGLTIERFLDKKKIEKLKLSTIQRGAEIVSLLGSGSAYFAPSAAITQIVRAIVKDEKRTICVSAYLNGEYGIRDICIGVPSRIGRKGIEQIIELELNQKEKLEFQKSAKSLKKQRDLLDELF